jgi:leucyl-tRNA synthetase
MDSTKTNPTFFATFPYPYMNGPLHLGHAFTMMKVDVTANYKRMNGFDVLFPFGFHITGMPIKAAADKLRKEIETGNIHEVEKVTQYEILQKSGIIEADIAHFTKYETWFNFFPQRGKEDLQSIGMGIDWSRSFVTTDYNPYYDRFVKWYFTVLKERGYIKFGKQHVIWSTLDKQTCSDHARKVGEKLRPKQFTMLKVPYEGIYLLAMTSEPDLFTKHGTHLEMSEKLVYNIYEMDSDKVICTEWCAKNLNHQGYTLTFIERYHFKKGDSDDMWEGLRINNNIKEFKGSGFVCCVDVDLNLPWKFTQFDYYEPEGEIISRSGDRCIVAYTDQWVLNYSNEEWKQRVHHHIDVNMTGLTESTKLVMKETVDWYHDKSFSRDKKTSLGTEIPWDTDYVIDSLSDSTIYMMYYTIAHYLHKDIYGKVPNKIPLDMWTGEVMDMIFLGATKTARNPTYDDISPAYEGEYFDMNTITDMRKEFRKWYPLDLRVSGKDLVHNHLVFCLFNHIALLGEDMAPRDFHVNGHILIDGVKMSKQEGNFITVKDGVEKYSKDALRFTLAYAGDGDSDANFETCTAENMQDKLSRKMEEIHEMLDDESYRISSEYTLTDRFFMNQIQSCIVDIRTSFDEFRFKDVCRYGLFEMDNYRREYMKWGNPRKDLLVQSIETQLLMLAPVIPNWVQSVYNSSNIWGCRQVSDCKFPIVNIIDENCIQKAMFYQKIWHHINKKLEFFSKYDDNVTKIHINFVKEYPSWYMGLKNIVSDYFAGNDSNVMKNIALEVNKHNLSKKAKKGVMSMAQKAVKTNDQSEFQGCNVDINESDLKEMIHLMSQLANVEIEYELVEKDDVNNIVPDLPKITKV